MFIGGSAAHGWKAVHNQSYLKRAFQETSEKMGQPVQIFDHTIPGETVPGLSLKTYEHWLKTERPDIVVLSWGLLNDVHQRTPLSTFDAAIRGEIEQALQAHAVVLMVTPPVTKASTASAWPLESAYMADEMRAAASFHSPNLYQFDLFQQMKEALQAAGQTVEPYAADGAHPNTAGHALAGRLLANDFLQRFGSSFPTFQAERSRQT